MNPEPETPITKTLAPPELQTPFAYRGVGKVARLPKPARDKICAWMLDGVSYPDIIEGLGPDAKDRPSTRRRLQASQTQSNLKIRQRNHDRFTHLLVYGNEPWVKPLPSMFAPGSKLRFESLCAAAQNKRREVDSS